MQRYLNLFIAIINQHLGGSVFLAYLKKRKKQNCLGIDSSYSASTVTGHNVKRFVQNIHNSGITIFFLKSITEYHPAFGVCLESSAHFCKVLEECAGGETAFRVNGRKHGKVEKALKNALQTRKPIEIFNRYISNEGRILFSYHNAVSLFFFTRKGQRLEALSDTDIMESFTASDLSEIDPDNLYRISSWNKIYSFYEHRYDVDIVYTWVNGNDPVWQAKKKVFDVDSDIPQKAGSTNRYRNRDELKYSLRSLFMYADWFNHIYIVTDDQVPEWLATHEKVKIVSHRDIFQFPNALPVFNSHAIESQLHRIEGLAEHFIYMNDDVFIGSPLSKSDFFAPFGKATKFFWSSRTFIPLEKESEMDPVDMAARNNANLLMQKFNVFPTRKFKHGPIACKKSAIRELETQFPHIFEKTCHSRFRSQSDYSILSGLIHHYGYLTGQAFPGDISYSYINLGSPQYLERLERLRKLPPHRMVQCFCINDVDNEKIDAEEVSRELIALLEYLYPFPSQAERPANRQQHVRIST